MSTPTIADLVTVAQREFRSAFGDKLAVKSCETFGEAHYRGGFHLTLADATDTCEVVYSDLEVEVRFNGSEVFGAKLHTGFSGNMFSREHLREHLPSIAASAAAEAQGKQRAG